MPIEIREITIKTEVTSGSPSRLRGTQEEMNRFKRQITEECRRMILQMNRKPKTKR